MTNFDIAASIDDFINTINLKPTFRDAGVHPSEIGEEPFCLRKKVLADIFHNKGINKNVPPQLRRIFDIGHILHDLVRQNYLGPSGILYGNWKCSRCDNLVVGTMPSLPCECTIKKGKPAPDAGRHIDSCVKVCGDNLATEIVESRGGCTWCGKWGKWEYQEQHVFIPDFAGLPGVNLTGHVDGIIFSPDGKKIVIDIKTISDDGFYRITRPKLQYVAQLNCYINAIDADYGIIYYVNKTNLSGKSFVVEKNLELFEETKQRAREKYRAIANTLQTGKLPDMHKKCTLRSLTREYCPFGGPDNTGICPNISNDVSDVDTYLSGNITDNTKERVPRTTTPAAPTTTVIDSFSDY